MIKRIREEKISRKEFARRHDHWHENTLKSYEKDRLPDIDYLYLLFKETGFDLRELIEARTRVVLQSVASAEEIEHAIALLTNTSAADDKKQIVVEDNAMEPYIQSGAHCQVDEKDKALTPGNIYCFRFEESFTCRKVHKTLLGRLILKAECDEHLSLELGDDDREHLDIVGKVVSASNFF
ncbi:S24 family peptidase [Alteromonas sp. KUL150]|uniref:S24 family peptidase n=1 Tax=Alteromonas sp. KUL150 TaxID=2480805 RepID=UPI00132FE7F1|nr:S24 family peptidase [Alteromonas sp. KUL150]